VWAREFANSLQQRGLKVWFDSSAIHPGQAWEKEVEKGLRESNVIVLLVTPDTIKRPNLYLEIGAAIGMGKPVILVASKRCRSFSPAAFPPWAEILDQGFAGSDCPGVCLRGNSVPDGVDFEAVLMDG